jgi:Tfp pilus assembly protein PilN
MNQAIEQLIVAPAQVAPRAAAQSPAAGRSRIDALGVSLLSDGRAVAVGLSQSRKGPPQAVVHVAAGLEELLAEVKSGRLSSRRMNLCLPRRHFIAKGLRLPTSDPAEVRTMLQFEVDNLVPFGDGKNVQAYLSSPSNAAGYTEVLVMVTPEPAIEEHLAAWRKGGAVPNRIVPAPAALLAWACVLAGDDLAQASSTLVLGMGGPGVEALVLRQGRLVSCRNVPAESDAAAVSSLVEEAFGGENFAGEAPPRIVAICPARREESIQRQLEGCLASLPGPAGTRQVECVRGVGKARLVGENAELAGGADEELSAAVALAAGAAAVEFVPELRGLDMLTGPMVQARGKAATRKLSIRTAVLAAVLAGFLGLLAYRSVDGLQQRIRFLRDQIAPVERTAQAVSQKRQQLTLLRSQLADRGLLLAALAELYKITPGGVNIVDLRISGHDVNFTAQALSPDQAYAFPTTLMNSKVFRKVHFRGAYPVTKGTGTITEFTCSCQVASPGAPEERP